MSNRSDILRLSSLLFWATLTVLILFMLPGLKNGLYNKEKANLWAEAMMDTLKQDTLTPPPLPFIRPSKNIEIQWSWRDYHENRHEIRFTVSPKDSARAVDYRNDYNSLFNIRQLYMDFIKVSKGPLDSLCKAMKMDIQSKNLTGQEVLDYVVSCIQTPPYTKITNINECPCFDMNNYWTDECAPKDDRTGCCNNVTPFAVYTPTEFILQKTGDCDTKALIAYAVLKKLGYHAALIVGEAGTGKHAMLALTGVRPVIQSQVVRNNGRIYYPWEVTNKYAEYKLGNMSMWPNWNNWEVICD